MHLSYISKLIQAYLSQRTREQYKIENDVRGRGGLDRTRICDLLRVKQAL